MLVVGSHSLVATTSNAQELVTVLHLSPHLWLKRIARGVQREKHMVP